MLLGDVVHDLFVDGEPYEVDVLGDFGEEPRFAGPDPYDGVKLAVLGHIHDVIEVIGIQLAAPRLDVLVGEAVAFKNPAAEHFAGAADRAVGEADGHLGVAELRDGGDAGLLGHHEVESGGVVEVGVGGDVGECLLVGGGPLDGGHVHGVHADGQIRLLLLELDDVGGGVAGQHGDFIVGVGIGERFGDEADAEVPAAGHGAGHGSQPGLFGKGGGGEQCDGQGHGSGYKVCTHGWNLQGLGFAIHSGTVRRPRRGNRPF